MSFTCSSHGWSHLLNPCPLCPTFYRYSTTSTEALVGVTSTHYDDLRAKLSTAEKERDDLKSKLAVAVDSLKVYGETHVWCMATMHVQNGKKGLTLWEILGESAREALKAINGGESG